MSVSVLTSIVVQACVYLCVCVCLCVCLSVSSACLPSGPQAADRGGVVVGRDSRQTSVQTAVTQEVADALLPADSGSVLHLNTNE